MIRWGGNARRQSYVPDINYENKQKVNVRYIKVGQPVSTASFKWKKRYK